MISNGCDFICAWSKYEAFGFRVKQQKLAGSSDCYSVGKCLVDLFNDVKCVIAYRVEADRVKLH